MNNFKYPLTIINQHLQNTLDNNRYDGVLIVYNDGTYARISRNWGGTTDQHGTLDWHPNIDNGYSFSYSLFTNDGFQYNARQLAAMTGINGYLLRRDIMRIIPNEITRHQGVSIIKYIEREHTAPGQYRDTESILYPNKKRATGVIEREYINHYYKPGGPYYKKIKNKYNMFGTHRVKRIPRLREKRSITAHSAPNFIKGVVKEHLKGRRDVCFKLLREILILFENQRPCSTFNVFLNTFSQAANQFVHTQLRTKITQLLNNPDCVNYLMMSPKFRRAWENSNQHTQFSMEFMWQLYLAFKIGKPGTNRIATPFALQMKRKNTFGKKRTLKKPPARLLKMCKRYRIKVTRKVGRKRVYKTVAVLKKQLRKKIHKMKGKR